LTSSLTLLQRRRENFIPVSSPKKKGIFPSFGGIKGGQRKRRGLFSSLPFLFL